MSRDAEAPLLGAVHGDVGVLEQFCRCRPVIRKDRDADARAHRAHLQEEPTLPSELWPEIPPALEKVLLRCLERQRTQRYASANALLEDLAELRA